MGVYIKDAFPCSRDNQKENSEFPFTCFRVTLVYSMYLIFSFYHPQNDGIVMFGKITEKTDDILFGSIPSSLS